MTISRRKFIKVGTLIALSASIPLKFADAASGRPANAEPPAAPPTGFRVSHESLADAAYSFKKSTFSPYLNTKFTIRFAPAQVLATTLVQVVDAGPVAGREADAAVGKECFALLFRAPRYAKLIPQKSYLVQHDALGSFTLFIVPTNKDAKGQYYQAIINHRQP